MEFISKLTDSERKQFENEELAIILKDQSETTEDFALLQPDGCFLNISTKDTDVSLLPDEVDRLIDYLLRFKNNKYTEKFNTN